MSAAVNMYFGTIASADAYLEAKKPVRQAIDDTRGKLKAKLSSLQQGLKDDRELTRLKRSGELILAYQYMITDGQELLHAQYDPECRHWTFRLIPSSTR